VPFLKKQRFLETEHNFDFEAALAFAARPLLFRTGQQATGNRPKFISFANAQEEVITYY
jgi:hypothetical protein